MPLRRLTALLLCTLLAFPALAQARAASFFWHPEIAPDGPVVIVVSLDEQHIYVYRNGVAIGVAPVSSGRRGHETPSGVYTILQKAREHYSDLYDSAPMPFMQRLTWDGIALHAGTVPGYPASHGCVRMPRAFAEKLFAVTRHGGVVVIADAMFPMPITHPAVVSPIDLSGQPMPVPRGNWGDTVPLTAAGKPVSVVVSTHDGMAYVLRDGVLVARSPAETALGSDAPGTMLYVMTQGAVAARKPMSGAAPALWSAHRILGEAAEPAAVEPGLHLQLPDDFGRYLQAAMGAGSSVLVTDLPGQGGALDRSYAAMLRTAQTEGP